MHGRSEIERAEKMSNHHLNDWRTGHAWRLELEQARHLACPAALNAALKHNKYT
jgi:hypothetical protein